MFEALPFQALVLDALAPAVENGLIMLRDTGAEGVLVVREGVVAETVWVADGVRDYGDEALASIHAADSATVSACRLPDAAMGLVGALIRGDLCYADLRLEWVVWPQLLNDLRERGGVFVVELATPSGRGVTMIEDGRQIATFAESHPTLGDADLLDALAAGGVGTVRVLVDRGAEARKQPESLSLATPVVAEPQRQLVVQQLAPPVMVDTDDPNATLSALFGPPNDALDDYRPIVLDQSAHRAVAQIESLLPQLKSLVQHRLQRSSGSVEELVDSAAIDGQSVAWLADRVRVTTVRGFLHSTFDQLADDMLALTAREPD
jgi:hypothetical protein